MGVGAVRLSLPVCLGSLSSGVRHTAACELRANICDNMFHTGAATYFFGRLFFHHYVRKYKDGFIVYINGKAVLTFPDRVVLKNTFCTRTATFLLQHAMLFFSEQSA